ncbi:DUF72 domain-containing protein [Variovorax terrae]
MQDALFPSDDAAPPPPQPRRRAARSGVDPVPTVPELEELAHALPQRLRMGTSSWHFPGWGGLVWQGDYSEALLSKQGLKAYAQHPLLRSVSLDRSFYRPLSASQYAAYAAQVPDDFRFVVKAPSLVADATVRGENGRSVQPNPAFLSPDLALQEFVRPVLEGLGGKAGALVFQLSPLPPTLLGRLDEVLARLAQMLQAVQPELQSFRATAPDAVVAVEVRNREFLAPAFAALLREAGATYCLGLHAKMPPIEQQLPVLRALWPGPLVCRWNLHRKHGAYGYEDAKALYQPFDKLVDPDPATREALARVIAGTTGAGQLAYVTINNKAEGSAPLSVLELARATLQKP